MGFLNRLSHLMHGSGVSVELQIMGADPDGQQSVQVLLLAKHEAKVVSNIELAIVHTMTTETSQMEYDDQGEPVSGTTQETESFTLYTQNSPVHVELSPGQPVSIPIAVPITQVLNNSGAMGIVWNPRWEVAGGFDLTASATVEGSHIQPQASQFLQRDMVSGFWG